MNNITLKSAIMNKFIGKIVFVLLLCLIEVNGQQPSNADGEKEYIQTVVDDCDFPANLTYQVRIDCIRKVAAEIFNEMNKGRSVYGIPPFEPVYIDRIAFTEISKNVDLRANFTDLYGYGFSNTNFGRNSVNYENRTNFFQISFPELNLEGTYKMAGNVVYLPMKGDGQAFVTVYNVDTRFLLLIDVRREHENGPNIIATQIIDFKFQFEKMNIRLTNLDVKDPIVEESIHHFLNNNPKFINTQIGPELEKAIGEVVSHHLRLIFERIPADTFYPAHFKPVHLWDNEGNLIKIRNPPQ